MKKTPAIILIDLENFATTKDNFYFSQILNLLLKKFSVEKILSFGNFYKTANFKNNEFINKDEILKEILKNEISFKNSLLFLIKNILLTDVKSIFINNEVSKNAADKNIIDYLENDILSHKELYLETTIILFSQDFGFKNILDKLTQNNIFNLVIGSPNEYYQHWEKLGQYRFEFNINKFLENKCKYLNDFHNLICEIKKTQNQQNCQHLTELNDINKIFNRLKVDLIKYKNKPRNLNALENHIKNIMQIKKLNLSKFFDLQEKNEIAKNVIQMCQERKIFTIVKDEIKYNICI